ncbi:hypothetical protein JNUCC42_05670 [Brevibacterium sp. JNUCC-42]|nr:hypothetical protein JNUCC42_05670 [Brevibacterium sp. JNUCC-42]
MGNVKKTLATTVLAASLLIPGAAFAQQKPAGTTTPVTKATHATQVKTTGVVKAKASKVTHLKGSKNVSIKKGHSPQKNSKKAKVVGVQKKQSTIITNKAATKATATKATTKVTTSKTH